MASLPCVSACASWDCFSLLHGRDSMDMGTASRQCECANDLSGEWWPEWHTHSTGSGVSCPRCQWPWTLSQLQQMLFLLLSILRLCPYHHNHLPPVGNAELTNFVQAMLFTDYNTPWKSVLVYTERVTQKKSTIKYMKLPSIPKFLCKAYLRQHTHQHTH